MNRCRSRGILRFLELKSIRESPPAELMKRLTPLKEGERFPLSAMMTGAEALWIQSAEHMVNKYADSRKEELRWLLLYFLELTSQGHIRISSEDIREDLPLWGGHCFSGAPQIFENLRVLVRENPRLFSPLHEDLKDSSRVEGSRAILYATDLSCFYLLKKRRFEQQFLVLLKNISGNEGNILISQDFESHMSQAYARIKDSPEYIVTEDTLKAALMVGRSRLSVITGGPGTGKTTILAGLLRLFLKASQKESPALPEIRLCAPTGRAAKRMMESMEGLMQDSLLGEAFSHPAETIHKLLGLKPGSPALFDEKRTLKADLIIVDEASMVDLNLMTALLRAMKAEARLVLVGDRDQLPSVESGALLSDLLFEMEKPGHRLSGRVLSLSKVHRNSGAILESSRMVIQGDSPAFLDYLKQPGRNISSDTGEKGWLHYGLMPSYKDLLNELASDFRALKVPFGGSGFRCLSHDWREKTSEIAPYFSLYRERIILSPTRKGLFGTVTLNRGLNEILGGSPDNHYHGQPVMVTRNDYERSLFNGDRGVVLRFSDGLFAFFEDLNTDYRCFPLLLLENRETSYALTIHKSQGSEYNRVHILMPEGAERLISREILYTGITRAREGVSLYGSEEIIRLCLSRGVRRLSGIRDFMQSS
ncbi:exodeoxyribonuclease V subunit alpha [Oceanispirochaeta sp.]|jgi:exodeoxyribonuclease V alpha subunit|uniref:exodeoxyribonuclease V subunit alpha n=1 Tax=Oceanispirochaeta sp. TaxID=2035350 RepID=UPI002619930E|nr:exodeoxyribonuclease V subunit alpha [Oceanispirochaeta sp.]MDA3958784.1 exodeoxyribonuclease V subunit alpha [Oceanispirochaeta sp.]